MNEYKLSNIKIGLEESFSVVIDSSKLDKFLDISNDLNPLHVDNSYAKEKGFDGRVVYGLLTASFYSTLVGVYLPGKYCILQSIDTQFLKPVYIGETLTIAGKISYINAAYKQIEIQATIVNQNGQKVSKATIKTGLIDE
jgi:3-hydroxybutyryl-CoA dehydratase|tara:strand:+ start:1089 stop:1508 length:420 start_codon:yes stop_codon:yes gene_type:complete